MIKQVQCGKFDHVSSYYTLLFGLRIVPTCENPYIKNGFIRTSGDLGLGTHVFYGCNNGFELFGIGLRTCTINASWTGNNPVCKGN